MPAAANETLGLASVLVAGLLVGLKLWALGATGALSVAASLADSAMDLMVSLGAMAALIYAAKPADEDHAFGHTSAEDLARRAALPPPALRKLADADAFGSLGQSRRNALWEVRRTPRDQLPPRG